MILSTPAEYHPRSVENGVLALEARVGAAGAEAGACRLLRIPVEYHRIVLFADQYFGSWLGASSGERFLDTELGEPVRQVTDRLVVTEVGLQDPPARLRAVDPERVLTDALQLEVRASNRLGPQDQPRRKRLGRGSPRLGDDPRQGEREFAQALPRRG